MPHSRFRAILGITLLSSIACLPFGCSKAAPALPEEPPVAPVEVAAARGILLGEWVELVGTTQPLPSQVARISSPVEGRVSAILKVNGNRPLAEGDQIAAGTCIVQLDTRVIQEQKKQAEYAVELAKIEVNRLEELAAHASTPLPLVSRIEISKARLGLEDAQSKLKGLETQQQLYQLTSPISGRLGMIQVVPGQTLSVGATVAEVVNLDPIDVLCYVPSSVASRLVLVTEPGTLAEGSDTITGLKDVSKIQVGMYVDGEGITPGTLVASVDREAKSVALGEGAKLSKTVPLTFAQAARLAGDKEADPPPGKIVFIGVQGQTDTGLFAVKVRFPNPDFKLRANLVQRVEVEVKPKQLRLTLPESALVEDQDPPGVVVMKDIVMKKNKDGKEEKNGKARKLRATIGIRDRTWHVVEIISLMDPTKKNQPVLLDDVEFIVKGVAGLQDDDGVKVPVEEDE